MDDKNPVEHLPENVAEVFPNLIHIWIIGSTTKTVTKANFKTLKQLQLLTIVDNKNLESIEEKSFDDLADLNHLDLSFNSITKLHQSTFSKLEKLYFLNLSANKLTSLNENIFKLNKNLESLIISQNNLMTVASKTLNSQKSLKFFWINHNEITHLPSNLFKSTEILTELHLEGNEISRVDTELLANLTNLRKVSFGGNLLKEVDFKIIETNENLSEISLESNKITTVANVETIKNMTKLREINLANNTCIDQVFFSLAKEMVHRKMLLYKIEERCSVLGSISTKNASSIVN